MSGNHCHARGTPDRIVLDVLPSAALAKPSTRTLPSTFPADGSDIPVPLHRELSDPVSERTPAESTAR